MTNPAEVKEILASAVGEVFPAAQLLVVDRGSEILSVAVGDATEETVFDLASLTKPLATTTLVMQLVERGALSLDEEARPGVTVRHLLAHASGLPAWKRFTPPREAVIEAVRREPLEAQPGARSVYSDLGFILLGALVEERTGERLDARFRREIAEPLGVATTYLPPDPARCAPCEGLRGVVHDDNARAMDGVAGHAGLFSTAREVAVIARALLASFAGAPGIVRPETVRAFWSPSAVPGSTWCLGWDRPASTGSSAGERWPKEGVGHLGFTGTSLWLDPPRGRAVVLLTNRVEPTRENQRIKAFRPRLHDALRFD